MLEFLTPYISLFGLTSFTVTGAAVAVAWFFPQFRTVAAYVAVASLIVFGSYTKGVRDTQREWRAAVVAEKARQEAANRAALRAAELRELDRMKEMMALRAENEELRYAAEKDEDAGRVALPQRSIERVNRRRQ